MMIAYSIFGIICALIFIIVITVHRQCHTLMTFLVLNSTVAGLIANITCLSQAVYQLIDLGNDPLCTVRGLLLHTSAGIVYHTLCLQALHRLFVTIYSTRRYLQGRCFNISILVIQWIFSISFALPIFFTNRIIYQPGSRICQVNSSTKR